MRDKNDNGNVWKGLVAGLAGGLVASWTMNQFQAAWTRIAEGARETTRRAIDATERRIEAVNKSQDTARAG